MVFDKAARIVAVAQKEHEQIFPRPGWVEHDALEIMRRTEEVIAEALEQRGLRPSDLAAIGITNQRETTVVWDRRSGEPIANAIVWQDTRVAEDVGHFAKNGGQDRFRAQTGLPLSTYFSSLKLRWLLQQCSGRKGKGGRGRTALRKHRHISGVEPHRRIERWSSRHRRDECEPDAAPESSNTGLG